MLKSASLHLVFLATTLLLNSLECRTSSGISHCDEEDGEDDSCENLMEDFMQIVDLSLDSAWATYKSDFDKDYDSASEELLRRLIWEENIRLIEQHNAEEAQGRFSYRLGLNEFGDLTNAEFKAMHGVGTAPPAPERQREDMDEHGMVINGPIPAIVDWRRKGCVGQVVNQGPCGSSWALAAVGAIEGQLAKKSGELLPLSVQQLLDCSRTSGNEGCNGGWMDSAFEYVARNGGIAVESAYPYMAQEGECRFNPDQVAVKISAFVDVIKYNETDLEAVVAKIGPVAVAFDASPEVVQFYHSGVYHDPDCDSENPTQGALVVGYGVSARYQEPYWLIKNSWGKSWGWDGYMQLAKESGNSCGVATRASFPVL